MCVAFCDNERGEYWKMDFQCEMIDGKHTGDRLMFISDVLALMEEVKTRERANDPSPQLCVTLLGNCRHRGHHSQQCKGIPGLYHLRARIEGVSGRKRKYTEGTCQSSELMCAFLTSLAAPTTTRSYILNRKP
jgi:hypothetical protein